ncbi:hypothetical protein RHECIAT_CH0003161 [Rhizobium etli CIAT 652]|uniref:Uncharacterized protein n=1 Tax=Rhizobium etli (strain CIAT 652) TaxID=491916 RepID=B3PUY4_RHIE6|nr:hypothetical protein RHECIAT_CH0003161 [Rhizobium etli CIAT 652]KKZ86302.1 hypothetical protein RPHASCH2410_CH17570 [Rhizobium phaseoli Ch24-10]
MDGQSEKKFTEPERRVHVAFLAKSARNLYCRRYKKLIMRPRRRKFCVSAQIGRWRECALNDTLKNFCLPKSRKRRTLASFGHFASMGSP